MTLRARWAALTLSILLVPFPAAAATVDDELSGTVWADINVNGIREATETGVPGVGVLLFRGSDGQGDGTVAGDAIVEQSTTAVDGTYGFAGLTSGPYVVQFLIPEGQVALEMLFFTHPDAGEDDSVDSDADPFTGRSDPVRYRGSPVEDVDAGLVGRGEVYVIGGVVWEDRDDDGIEESGEPLMDGVAVNLLRMMPARDRRDRRGRATFEVVDTTTTRPGAPLGPLPGYDFYVLPGPARYVVEVVPPDSHETVARDRDASDEDDSDVDPVSRRSDPVVADRDHVLDIGLAPLSAIGDYAWVDGDRDGLQDPEETGLEGVLVLLERLVIIADPDDPEDDVETWVLDDMKITDGGGFYGFGRRRPGTYRLRFIPADGFGFTRFQVGDDRSVDSDAMPDSGLTPDFDLPDDAGPPGDAALERILEASERAQAGLDPDLVGATPVGGGGPGVAGGGFPALYADQWDTGFIRGTGSATVAVPADGQPVVCASGKRARDPEVTISGVQAYRLPNGDRVFLVRLAKGLEKDYSFAVVLYVRTPLGTLMFMWELHDKVFRIGQADPETGELIGEDGEDVHIVNLRGEAIVAFLVKAGVIPEGSDLFLVRSFHSPTRRSMTNCHLSMTGTLDDAQAPTSEAE